MKKQVKNGVIKVLILVLILAGAYGLWCHFLTDNVIWKKLKINGIAIQGMTKEEAIDAISKDFQEKYENTQMTITLNGKNFKVSIYPVLGLDVKSIVESAYALGHGAWFTHGTDRIELMNSPYARSPKQRRTGQASGGCWNFKGIHHYTDFL